MEQKIKQTNISLCVKLFLDIYEMVLDSTETFYDDNIGADLAYLAAAIFKDTFVEFKKDSALLKLIQTTYKDPTHGVYKFIRIEEEGSE
jgi:hypothetical protein